LNSASQVSKVKGAEKVIITSQLETEFGKLTSNCPFAPTFQTLVQVTKEEQLPVGDVSVVVVTIVVVDVATVVVVAVVVVAVVVGVVVTVAVVVDIFVVVVDVVVVVVDIVVDIVVGVVTEVVVVSELPVQRSDVIETTSGLVVANPTWKGIVSVPDC
jgi:hypothetical protein